MKFDKTFKVEVGQEWKRLHGLTIFIVSKIKDSWAHEYNVQNSCHVPKIRLTSDNTIINYNLWEYLGTPKPCEDCCTYCRQNLCVFSPYWRVPLNAS